MLSLWKYLAVDVRSKLIKHIPIARYEHEVMLGEIEQAIGRWQGNVSTGAGLRRCPRSLYEGCLCVLV